MKTFIYLVLTAFIATGAMFAGLNQHNLGAGYAFAALIWTLFIRYLTRRR